ncbi:MAG: transketolase family protein [Candidatus Omnitrophica bacterium]|nr:transketolase family protein [Candidatus Omnitrophota bacterium]
MQYQRNVYGKALVELGRENKDIIVLDADLSSSTRTAFFAKEFPERFFNMGIAEQNMMAVAAGLASCGKVVFVSTFALFAAGRAWDQVRNTICHNNLNVKIVATHSGISVGPDGASHQALEDIALMRVIPKMSLIVPADAPQTKQAILAAAKHPCPVYIRLGRPKVEDLDKQDFRIGKANIIKEGRDISIIACGIMVKQALDAANILSKEGIAARVVNMSTIKPIDKEIIFDCLKQTKGIITAEEHSIIGGLGGAVSEIVSEIPTKKVVRKIGTRDRFGQSGEPQELMKEYGLTAQDIADAGREILMKNV